jgi:peptidoglycan/xylan/chitin deacetylase (PgdA/CDA1 family)
MIRSARRVARALAGLHRRLSPGPLILLYHRIADLSPDPFDLAVSPGNFSEHLEVLRQHARPTRLRQLVEGLVECRRFPRSVVVTFDDGYADNLHAARPLLDRLDVPATAFIASSCLGPQREFWWDELEALLLHPGTLPDSLSFEYEGGEYLAELGTAATLSEADFERHRGWTFSSEQVPTPRHTAFCGLYCLLKALPPAEQDQMMCRLREWAAVPRRVRPEYRTLTPEELVELGKEGLVEIGAHTHSHPALISLSVEDQRGEIRSSRARIEEVLGRRPVSFSYPYGLYSAATVAEARDAGFGAACTTREARVLHPAQLMELPRVWVGNWNGEEFANRLHRWFAT